MLYGALVVTLLTCYGALQIVVLLLLLLLSSSNIIYYQVGVNYVCFRYKNKLIRLADAYYLQCNRDL